VKALRFHVLRLAARVIEHGRRLWVRLSRGHPSFALYREVQEKLLRFSSA
jgi:transketolase N-terminal domain/subunit